MTLNPELLDILACPVCRGAVEPIDNESGLECTACALVFPVQDSIPIMLKEEAISKDDWDRGQRKA
ncbi:MAG: Trm112 family protein [Bilophila sp.]